MVKHEYKEKSRSHRRGQTQFGHVTRAELNQERKDILAHTHGVLNAMAAKLAETKTHSRKTYVLIGAVMVTQVIVLLGSLTWL